eukprot:GHVS01009882.1.p1 GENE.GHVS01009882.1~~GHVS01009882.1.p1  ORF type:complete len:119 (+),score=16.53 GHVS01009882.1:36-392(+)
MQQKNTKTNTVRRLCENNIVASVSAPPCHLLRLLFYCHDVTVKKNITELQVIQKSLRPLQRPPVVVVVVFAISFSPASIVSYLLLIVGRYFAFKSHGHLRLPTRRRSLQPLSFILSIL